MSILIDEVKKILKILFKIESLREFAKITFAASIISFLNIFFVTIWGIPEFDYGNIVFLSFYLGYILFAITILSYFSYISYKIYSVFQKYPDYILQSSKIFISGFFIFYLLMAMLDYIVEFIFTIELESYCIELGCIIKKIIVLLFLIILLIILITYENIKKKK